MENQIEKTPLASKSLIKQSITAEELISQAIERNLPVENLERLLAFAKEIKAIQAKEAFDRAMAELQAELPIIKKEKSGGTTETGKVAYKYAPLDSIVEQTKGLIQKHGFSYSNSMELIENGVTKVKVIIKVTHELGHSEVSDMTVPLGAKTRVMSDTQVVAAAQTFAKRYAFCNAFGILTGDEDIDGQTDKMTTVKLSPVKMRNIEPSEDIDINELVPGTPPVNLLGKDYEKFAERISKSATIKELESWGSNIKFLGKTLTEEERKKLRIVFKKKMSELEKNEIVIEKGDLPQ